MSREHTSFILGYHGCSKKIGEEVLAGLSVLQPSNEKFDWLGPGIYFWEADPTRAMEWARDKVARGEFKDPFVIGAVIDLGNCLDLMVRGDLNLVRNAYFSLKSIHDADPGLGALPENKPLGDRSQDNPLRFLDCATIKHLHAILKNEKESPFDTVRGLFPEGGELFPGSGFQSKNHIQVAVCNSGSIKAYFRPRPEDLIS